LIHLTFSDGVSIILPLSLHHHFKLVHHSNTSLHAESTVFHKSTTDSKCLESSKACSYKLSEKQELQKKKAETNIQNIKITFLPINYKQLNLNHIQ
jgi:hypothetical protein